MSGIENVLLQTLWDSGKENLVSKSVLVTGGAGFIASHVASELLKQGYYVVILDDSSGGNVVSWKE